MHSAYRYFNKSEETSSRISSLKTRNATFLSLPKPSGPVSIISKNDLESLGHSRSATALIKQPRKLDDLMTIKSIADHQSSGQSSEATNRRLQLEQCFTKIIDRRFSECLCKSVGVVSSSTFEHKARNLGSVWHAISQLPMPGKVDRLVGLLMYRLAKNTFGKPLAGVVPVSHYQSVLNSVLECSGAAIQCIEIMADQAEAGPDAYRQFTLSRPFADAIRSQINYLVRKLAENGTIASEIDSIFFPAEELENTKAEMIKCEQTKILNALRNTLLSLSLTEAGFDRAFKSAIEGEVSEENTTESVKRVIKLIKFYPKAKQMYLNQLNSDDHRETIKTELDRITNNMLSSLSKYHRLKSVLDKDTSQKLVVLLNSN